MLLPFLLSLLIIRRLVIQNTQGNRRLVSLISKWLSRIADQRFSPLFHVRKVPPTRRIDSNHLPLKQLVDWEDIDMKYQNTNSPANIDGDGVRINNEPKADLFRSVCRDSKDPEKCRLYVERLELASLNIVH